MREQKVRDFFDLVIGIDENGDPLVKGEKRIDRRQIKTKRAILEAYFNIMVDLDDSSKKISISQLSRAANIDRKTFYLHYADAEAVHRDIDRTISEFIGKIIFEYTKMNTKFMPFILLRSVNDFLNMDLDFFRRTAKCDAFRDSIDAIKKAFFEALVNLHCDEEHPLTEKKRLALLYISSGAVDLYVDWLKEGTEMTLDELALFTGRLLTKGVDGIVEEVF